MFQSQKRIREKNKIFLGFCKLACPDYVKNTSKARLAQISLSLIKYEKMNVMELYKTIEKILSNPEAITINKNEIPYIEDYRPKKDSFEYKQKASRFIEETTGILIPASASVSEKFYDSIIRNLIQNPKIKTTSLEEKLVEGLEFMKEFALRSIPSCVYGTIQRIENTYKSIKEYLIKQERENGRNNKV